jgi:hypothetical protein
VTPYRRKYEEDADSNLRGAKPARERAAPKPRSDRSPDVKRQAVFVARLAGRGLFKATALVAAFGLIVAAWLWDASLLTQAADENLRLIKAIAQQLPPDWASKSESALRIFGADRAMLLIEGVAVAKLLMLGLAYPFRRRRR